MPSGVRHRRPDGTSPNGKVANVICGIRLARHEMVVVADDDVRWSEENLAAAQVRFRSCDVVRPQNFFRPIPWHACFDTARTLLVRLAGGDWPGTLIVRRSAFERAGCEYRGDVLFENLEMVRTLKAVGAREDNAPDLYVARRPPTFGHFLGQQVRQAYDEFRAAARVWRSRLRSRRRSSSASVTTRASCCWRPWSSSLSPRSVGGRMVAGRISRPSPSGSHPSGCCGDRHAHG